MVEVEAAHQQPAQELQALLVPMPVEPAPHLLLRDLQ
jgi:hypothetical protein